MNAPRLYIIVRPGPALLVNESNRLLAWSDYLTVTQEAARVGGFVSNWGQLQDRFLPLAKVANITEALIIYTEHRLPIYFHANLCLSRAEFMQALQRPLIRQKNIWRGAP